MIEIFLGTIKFVLHLNLRIIDLIDILSKLAIPIILGVLGYLLNKSYFQYSQVEKMKFEKLTELVKNLYNLRDNIIAMQETTHFESSWKNINPVQLTLESFSKSKDSFNSSRMFITDKVLIEKIDEYFKVVNSIIISQTSLQNESPQQLFERLSTNLGNYKKIQPIETIKIIENEIKKTLKLN